MWAGMDLVAGAGLALFWGAEPFIAWRGPASALGLPRAPAPQASWPRASPDARLCPQTGGARGCAPACRSGSTRSSGSTWRTSGSSPRRVQWRRRSPSAPAGGPRRRVQPAVGLPTAAGSPAAVPPAGLTPPSLSFRLTENMRRLSKCRPSGALPSRQALAPQPCPPAVGSVSRAHPLSLERGGPWKGAPPQTPARARGCRASPSPSPAPGPCVGAAGRRLVLPHGTLGSTARLANVGLTGPSLSPERGAKPVTSFVKNLSALSDWHSVYTSAIAFTVSAPRGWGRPPGSSTGPRCAGAARGQLSLGLPTCEVGTGMPPGGVAGRIREGVSHGRPRSLLQRTCHAPLCFPVGRGDGSGLVCLWGLRSLPWVLGPGRLRASTRWPGAEPGL